MSGRQNVENAERTFNVLEQVAGAGSVAIPILAYVQRVVSDTYARNERSRLKLLVRTGCPLLHVTFVEVFAVQRVAARQ
jgi:hypothetical protein